MMPSVGPELPPHLKRKRSEDDDNSTAPESPPHKVVAASGPEPPRRLQGPTAPPAPKNEEEIDLSDEDDDDDYGPAAPKPPPKTASPPAQPQRRVLGPALPPASLDERPESDARVTDDSSDSDDDYGPAPPPAPGSAAEAALRRAQQEQAWAEAASPSSQAQSQQAKPQRAEWMLVPPSDSDWGSRVDPTKLKARKFASGKGASKAPSSGSGEISAIWTETPEEKRRRLEDEVLGRKDATAASNSGKGDSGRHLTEKQRAEEEATARKIREYNERNRGKSLYDEHNKASQREKEEDDPSKRAFDKEKDMALAGRIGHSQRKELLSKAADFGSRFQKGKYL